MPFRTPAIAPRADRKHDLRPATAADAVHASHVLHRSITECCDEDHRGDPAALQAWLGNKTVENVGHWIQNPQLFSVVAMVQEKMVGFAMSTRSGKVLLCYLIPDVLHQGIGKAMLQAMEDQARQDGIDTLCLESTQTAKPFYLRNHFVQTAPPTLAWGMHCYPMRKTLTQE